MGTNPTKAADNIYCQARYEAAKYNDKLYSREGAAELLGISVSTLSDYELGTTKFIPPDRIIRMADLYNAPELLNNYCVNECPIGCRNVKKLEIAELDRLTVKVLSALQHTDLINNQLLGIAEDGKISDEEQPQLKVIIENLDKICQCAEELKLWAQKNIGKNI